MQIFYQAIPLLGYYSENLGSNHSICIAHLWLGDTDYEARWFHTEADLGWLE